jgi:hypothetical protein
VRSRFLQTTCKEPPFLNTKKIIFFCMRRSTIYGLRLDLP